MMGQGKTPGVEHGGQPEANPEVLQIRIDSQQGLGGGLKQDGVNHRLVLVGN
jgi:hypothetical protein